MRKKILKRLQRDAKERGIFTLAKTASIPYACLYRIVHETSDGAAKTWDKIYSFYGIRF